MGRFRVKLPRPQRRADNRFEDELSRRQFLSVSAKAAALTFGATLVGLLRKSARATEGIPGYPTVLDKIRTAHRVQSTFPSNPAAVAYDPKITDYPTKDFLPYDREINPAYPLVEEAMMLLSPEDPENPLSTVIYRGPGTGLRAPVAEG